MQRQIMSSTLLFLAVSMLQALMQVVLLPFHTHYLTPSEYGILATVMACSTILNLLFNLGLHGAAQRFTADYQNSHSEKSLLWSTVLLLAMIACVATGSLMLITLALLPFNIFVDFSNLPYLLFAVIHSIAMGVMLVGAELLLMYQQPRRYALAFALMYLSYLPMNLLFVGLLHWQVSGALLAHAIMPWIGCVILILTNLDYLAWNFERRLIRELLAYSIKILPHFTFSTLNSVSDRLLITVMLGKHFTGIYSAGSMLASLMPMLVAAIGFAARPQIYAKFAQNTPAALKEVSQLALTAMLIIALAGSIIALWSPETLLVLTSSAYHNAWPVTMLLTLKYMLQGLVVFIICSVLYNKVQVQKLIWVTGTSLVVLIFCSTALAPRYGIWGVAIAALIATGFNVYYNNRLSKKTHRMIWPMWRMLAIVAVFFIPTSGLVALTYYAHWPLWVTIIIKLLFSLSCLVATLVITLRQYHLTLPALFAILMRNPSAITAAPTLNAPLESQQPDIR